MIFTLTTPALLFPAISLLLLAYTNRYSVLASLIRNLLDRDPKTVFKIDEQIYNLKRRIHIIQYMQLTGVTSFFLCVMTMLLLFLGFKVAGEIVFGFSLVSLLTSLVWSIVEISISHKALDTQLDNFK